MAFSLAWMKVIQENNIGRLGGSFVTERPAENGLHNVAFAFVEKMIKAGFSQPRKQLANNLTKNLNLNPLVGIELDKKQIEEWLLKNSIKPCQRAETLSLENWISLAKSLPY